jgi:hypothetical protein
MIDLRSDRRERRVSNRATSIKIFDKRVWTLLRIYLIRHKKEFTKGQYLEKLIKQDLKLKKEAGEFDQIREDLLEVLDEP